MLRRFERDDAAGDGPVNGVLGDGRGADARNAGPGDDDFDGFERRYSTVAEARTGHAAIVEMVRSMPT